MNDHGVVSISCDESEKKPKTIPNKSGVYCLRYLMKNHKPKHFKRILDNIDKEGILYIGCTKDLKKRIDALADQLCKGSGNHTASWTYDLYFKHGKKKLDTKNMQVLWKRSPGYKNEEKAILATYCTWFGDMPPFNSSRERIKDDRLLKRVMKRIRKTSSIYSYFN